MDKSIESLKGILATVDINSCPYKLNFHCHTNCSDGSLSPIELYHEATNIGLTELAITDHHTVRAYKEISQWIQNNSISKQTRLRLWSGIEITSLIDNCLVHILGLGFNPDSEFMSPYINSSSVKGNELIGCNVVSAIHKAGGLAILAHPARYRLDFKRIIKAASEIGIDGGEAWYDYEFNNPWKPSSFVCNAVSSELAKYNLLMSCGTDTHGTSLLKR